MTFFFFNPEDLSALYMLKAGFLKIGTNITNNAATNYNALFFLKTLFKLEF